MRKAITTVMQSYYTRMKDVWSENYPSTDTPEAVQAFYKSMGLGPVEEFLDPLMERVPFERKRILDFGTDNGVMLNFFRKYGAELHGIDINEDSIRKGRKQFPDFQLAGYDGVTLPYPDDHFDLVFASAVLKHIRYEDRNSVYEELSRVARYLIVFEKTVEKNHTEEAHGFTFYHTNFPVELENFFTPERLTRHGDQLFALYRMN